MTADTVGGVWSYAIELCRAFEHYGIEVALATMGNALTKFQQTEAASLSNTQMFESEYKLEWMDSPWSDVDAAGEWLLGLEEKFEPDLIHLNGYCHASLPWRAPKLVVGHSCVLSWWRAVKGCDAPSDWRTYQERVQSGLRVADLIIAPTEAMLNCLQEHYGPLRATKVIPNGRKLLMNSLRSKEPFIFSAGRLWDEAKNVSALSRVAPNLPWPVFVAGDGRCPSRTSAGEGKSAEVRHLGRLGPAEMADWYARASIYALPARYEPFGLSILEAALARCALVVGDIPSLREVWGNAAIYVPPDDQEALQDTLEDLISDETLRDKMSELALSRAQEFTPQRMGDGYLEAYSALLQRASRQEVACA
jgi:glycogen(starch) synthase